MMGAPYAPGDLIILEEGRVVWAEVYAYNQDDGGPVTHTTITGPCTGLVICVRPRQSPASPPYITIAWVLPDNEVRVFSLHYLVSSGLPSPTRTEQP